MAYKEKWDVHGLEGINRELRRLPEQMEQNILRSMVRAGGQVVRKNAMDREGLPKDSLVVRASRSRSKRGAQVVIVSVTGKYFYLMFKELGTLPHTISVRKKTRLSFDQSEKKALAGGGEVFGYKVEHPGQQAEPFLRPALFENINKVIEAMRQQGAKRFDKLGKRT